MTDAGTIDFRTWVPDRTWRTPARVAICGWHRVCPNPPIAEVDKHATSPRAKRRWVGFCAEHLGPYYRVRAGAVETAVAPGSPAAKRGWTGYLQDSPEKTT